MVGRTLSRLSDPVLNRVVVGVVVVLVVGTAVMSALYVADRWVPAGPSYVVRHTQELEAAVRQSPNDVTVRLQLAAAYMSDQRDGDALVQLNQILRAQPANKSALVARGTVHQRQRDLDAAAGDYQAVVDEMNGQEFAGQDQDLAAAYYGLGEVALAKGAPGDAVAPLKSALQIDGTNADALYALGDAYLQSGSVGASIDSYRRAVSFVPVGWAEPYQALATAYAKSGDTQEAAWATAMVDVARKRVDQARQAMLALVNGSAASDAYAGLGMIAELEGDTTVAADAYGRAIERDPNNVAAAMGRARVSPVGSPVVPASPTTSRPSGLSLP